MNLPPQLQREEFRFLLVDEQKRPLEQAWQSTANYAHDDKRVQLARNLGVLCGKGGLIVLDFDDAQAQERLLPHLPETFTVKTAGKGLFHLYYFTDEPTTIRINSTEETPRRLLDVQGRKTQVVAPGSFNAKTGRHYVVARDLPIARLTIAELRKAIQDAGFNESPAKTPRMAPQPTRHSGDGLIAQIKQKLSVPEALRYYGVDTRKNPTMCPLGHHSSGQKCLSYTQDVWHCFHCDESGDSIILVEKKEGLCRADAIRKAAEIAGIPNPQDALLRDLLPEVYR